MQEKNHQIAWQLYARRNGPMPGPELKGMTAPRGNRVLKAKDLADRKKFPRKKWWECNQWQDYCPPKSHFSTLGLSVSELTERAFQRNLLRHKRHKRRK
jgi:hypothetical protein